MRDRLLRLLGRSDLAIVFGSQGAFWAGQKLPGFWAGGSETMRRDSLPTPLCELIVMPNSVRFHSPFTAEHPAQPPFRHLLSRATKDDRRRRTRTGENRRKSCALIGVGAHISAPVVRVEALTNKAAHNAFPLVRTEWYALRGLTSIYGTTEGNICRKRRHRTAGRRFAVRNLLRGCAHREMRTVRGAH